MVSVAAATAAGMPAAASTQARTNRGAAGGPEAFRADRGMMRAWTGRERWRHCSMRAVSGSRKNTTRAGIDAERAPRDPGPARGVLQPAGEDGGASGFHHVRLPPSPALAHLVQHYWHVRWDLGDEPPRLRETLPHPNPHLVVDADGARLWGVHVRRFSTTLSGRGAAFGIKFRVGGLRLPAGAPLSRLRNRSVPAEDAFGEDARGFAGALHAARDDAGRVRLAETLLAGRAAPPDAASLLCADIAEAIASDPGLVRVEQVLARWPMHPRALQRLFDERVGVGVKWMIARYRLHEAVERIAASAGPIDWVAFAQDLGYYDQAHFIRDFRGMVGQTPAAYLRRFRGTERPGGAARAEAPPRAPR